ncbi:MAG: nucleotidyltransferase domain-containing protein [Candidatus Omnitrophota bacterium]|nr:MAG: nucleotidyltransferase domain-containing protein [Candidatus Omnitrophota bacterium]
MPVRSLHSSVLKWPDFEVVIDSLHSWTEKILKNRNDISRIGYYGSYARGDWGVGSDLDLMIVLKHTDHLSDKIAVEWDTTDLPVPVDLSIYSRKEWQSLDRQGRFYQTLQREMIWIYPVDNCNHKY